MYSVGCGGCLVMLGIFMALYLLLASFHYFVGSHFVAVCPRLEYIHASFLASLPPGTTVVQVIFFILCWGSDGFLINLSFVCFSFNSIFYICDNMVFLFVIFVFVILIISWLCRPLGPSCEDGSVFDPQDSCLVCYYFTYVVGLIEHLDNFCIEHSFVLSILFDHCKMYIVYDY